MPVRQLPVEIIAIIVEFATNGYHPQNAKYRTRKCLIIAAVCQAWRPIGLKARWRSLKFRLDADHDRRFRRLWKPDVLEHVAPYISKLEIEDGAPARLPEVTGTLAKLATSLTSIHLNGVDLFHAFSLSMLNTASALSTRLRRLSWTCHSDSPVSLNSLLLVVSQLPSLEHLNILLAAELPLLDAESIPDAAIPARLPLLRTLELALGAASNRIYRHEPRAAPTAPISAVYNGLLDALPTFVNLAHLDGLAVRGPIPPPALDRLLRSTLNLRSLKVKFSTSLHTEYPTNSSTVVPTLSDTEPALIHLFRLLPDILPSLSKLHSIQILHFNRMDRPPITGIEMRDVLAALAPSVLSFDLGSCLSSREVSDVIVTEAAERGKKGLEMYVTHYGVYGVQGRLALGGVKYHSRKLWADQGTS
ncbi:hypothetical protein JCM11641_001105 [Rhodosporidiobolus odoratus]